MVMFISVIIHKYSISVNGSGVRDYRIRLGFEDISVTDFRQKYNLQSDLE